MDMSPWTCHKCSYSPRMVKTINGKLRSRGEEVKEDDTIVCPQCGSLAFGLIYAGYKEETPNYIPQVVKTEIVPEKLSIDFIRDRIRTEDKWLFRAILAIYEKQTYSEQNGHRPEEKNGEGYNKFDIDLMSSFAEQLLKQEKKGEKLFLTVTQKKVARNRIMKYASQLLKIAEKKKGIKNKVVSY